MSRLLRRLAWASVLVLGCGLGALTSSRGIISAQGASRALRAHQVWFGGMPSIRSLGFDLPPLPTLLELPLALLPGLGSTAEVGAIVASLAAVLLGWSLLHALRAPGLGSGATAVLTVAVLLNPLLLYAVATGAGEVLGTALLVLGLRLVVDWARDERRSLSLFGGAFAFGLAGLARYDLVLVAAALTAVVALMAGRQPGQRVAYAIAFGTPAAAMLGLWLVVNWLATGNPLTFVGQTVPAGSSGYRGTGNSLAHFLLIAPVMVFALPGAGALLARGGSAARAAVVLGVVALVLVGWIGVEAVGGGGPSLLAGLPLAPVSVLLLGSLARLLASRANAALLVGATAAACVLLPFGALAEREEAGEGYPSFVAALSGQAVVPMWSSEEALGAAVREQSQARDVLLDDQHDALAAFFVRAPGHLIATGDPDYAAVLSNPRGRARLILVQTPGGDDEINAAWPRLYAGGVPWAEQVGEWAVSGEPTSRYRLFAVRAS